MENKNNSILLIAYLYGGEIGTSSVRSTKFSEEFTKFFHSVHVITQHNVNVSEDINIYPIAIDSFKDKVKGKKGKQLLNEKQKQSWFFKQALKLTLSFPTNLLLADANMFYISSALKKAEEIIKENNITHIYSSKRPYGDHYVAYLLKRKYPHLKWIADFRDLYIEPVYNMVYLPSIQKKIEQKILNKADIVTTVSNGLKYHLDEYNRPTYNIMRGMEIREQIPYFTKFTITYTGSLFQDYRDPRPLFKNLRDLIDSDKIDKNDVQIIYAGKDQSLFIDWVKEFSLEDIFIGKGLITRDEAQELQSKSHINLLLSSSAPDWKGVLTGKVFEYIESCNTTLCLIQGVQDEEFEELFEELDAGVVVYSPEINKGRMSSFVLDNYSEWKTTGTLTKKVNTEKISENHSWESRAQQIINLV